MNFTEYKAAEELVKLGWSVINKGWPDFLLWRDGPGGPEIMAVEVKSENHQLTPEQKFVLDKLALVMPVYVVRQCADGQMREWRINHGANND